MIRGRSVDEAQAILRYTPKRASQTVGKVLGSAVANATEKGAKERELLVETVLVGPGPTLKRTRAGSRGRFDPQLHRTCHITVVVSDQQKQADSSQTKPKSDKLEVPDKSKSPQTKSTKKEEAK